MAQDKRFTNGITEGVIWRQLLLFFFPILLGTFFQQLYNTVDAMVVGRFVGKEALAAVGGTTSVIINLFINLFMGISSGATVVISQCYGARDLERLHRAVHTAIAMALAAGAVITVVGAVGSRWALQAMGTPADVMDYAASYLQIYFLGTVASFIYNMGSAILRAVGDTRRPLYFLIAACMTNIVLDLLFVVGFHWGVAGAAIATILSQVVSAVLVSLSLLHKDTVYQVQPRQVRIYGPELKKLLAIGLPAGLQSDMYSISNILIQSSINSFGTNIMAAWSAYGKLDSFFFMASNAYGVSMTTFVGQNFGAQRFDRIHKAVRVCALFHLGTSLLFSGAYWAFGRPLLSLFVTDPEVLSDGMLMIHMLAPTFFTFMGVEVLASTIRATGETLPSMLLVSGGVCGLRVVWILALLPFFHDIRVVLVSYPLSWSLTSLLFLVYYLRGNWLRRQCRRMGFVPPQPHPEG